MTCSAAVASHVHCAAPAAESAGVAGPVDSVWVQGNLGYVSAITSAKNRAYAPDKKVPN